MVENDLAVEVQELTRMGSAKKRNLRASTCLGRKRIGLPGSISRVSGRDNRRPIALHSGFRSSI
jgi:hypothetical protein